MASDWQMPRRNEACAGCGHAFEVGQPMHAFLYESREGYARRDYCERCHPPDQPAPLGFWRTQRPAPPVKKTRVFDREAIYGLFRQLEGADEPEKIRLRFVLALLLWRKKGLKFERSERTVGREVWHFAVPQTDETHRVARPELDEEQIERLSTQLEQVLAGQADDTVLAADEAEPGLVIAEAEPEDADG